MNNLIIKIKDFFAASRFSKPESAFMHVSLIAGGTVIAQVIGILALPVISRIYSPADYGIMALYASVITILGELSGFRYYLAIPLPKDERYAKALVVLSLALQIIFISLLSFLLFVAGAFLLKKLSMTELLPYRGLIPLGLIATGTYLVLTQWAIREKLFSTIARTRITQSLSGVVAKITLGLLGIRPLGLLIGTIIAQGGGITPLFRSLQKKKGIPRPEKGDIKRVALRYRKFPMYGTFLGVFIAIGGRIPSLVLVALYSTQIAGLFAIAQQLLSLPSTFIGQAIGQVFIQRGSLAKRSGDLDYVFVKTYQSLIRIGLFPIILISFLTPQIFSWFLGENWIRAGVFARIISPWTAINFVYYPLSNIFSILERQKIGLLFEFLHLPLRIAALYLGAKFGDEEMSLLYLTIINCGVYFLKLSYLNSITGNRFLVLLKDLLVEFSWTFILLLLPIFSLTLNLGLFFLSVALLLSLGLYFLSVVLFFKKEIHAKHREVYENRKIKRT